MDELAHKLMNDNHRVTGLYSVCACACVCVFCVRVLAHACVRAFVCMCFVDAVLTNQFLTQTMGL